MGLTLILGGARSGKSDYAERLAQTLSEDVLFIATAQAFDADMEQRIARHRDHRPSHWHTLETPTGIAEAVARTPHSAVVIVDCITLLISNLLLREDADEVRITQAIAAELDALEPLLLADDMTWIIVSNEVGLGIVPDNAMARVYRDVLGRANQRLARVAERVVLMVAGIPMTVKP